jgi:predicted nucleic acid-binding protein
VILVDTSIWVDHLRAGLPDLQCRLERSQVLIHPWIIGEIALGNLVDRQQVLGLLSGLPSAVVATPAEVQGFIERHQLFGLGIGYVDVGLLAATTLTADARLWTRDRRLGEAAHDLHVAL